MKIEKSPTKYIVEGKLVSSSPSAIESFSELSSFGCNRKYWFEAVAGLRGPDSESAKLGSAVHGRIEMELDSQRGVDIQQPLIHLVSEIVKPGLPVIHSLSKAYPDYQIEQWIPDGFEVDGIKIRGRLDFFARDGGKIVNITDWKTTSNIGEYAKLPMQLKKDTQMLLYRQWAEEAGCDENLSIQHVYFQTKKPYGCKPSPTTINRQELSEGMERVRKTLDEMKKVANILDSNDVKPDKRKCRLNTKIECPYAKYCHGDNMASLIHKFLTTPASETPAPEVQKILPPDAPASRPELAADPVPGFSATPVPIVAVETPTAPVKRGRGRPKAAPTADVERLVLTADAPAPEPVFKVLELTIGHTATINMGNYQSAKVEVTMRASVTGDLETARAQLTEQVRGALAKEVEVYQKEKR